ncbi:laminin subunit alpha-5 isoform X2 [Neoarius graeffei]|uniref:laminin subunit alpha-5 isoform X2 n=1 Tax=Neoarius graeffei TaxID=443677 RepID=UPI00298D016A|nr:laminin subunit alpha-5 isoform X2 [Neoarius graeffei]
MALWGVQTVVVALACVLGVVRSQTTLIPAVTTITVRENVTTTTPIMPSTTTSVCSIFNTSSCEACAPGTYYNNETLLCSCCPEPGLCISPRACLPCTPGFYTNSSSCAQCQMCPVGSEALKNGNKQCSPCRPGMHKTSHQKRCQICSSGFYQIHWGKENCDICPEDHYCPSPDVNPIQCPSDAFCPEGSTAPGYCMETFFRKAGDTCELAPVTIALIVIGGGLFLLFIVLLVFRRRRDIDSELSLSRAPLLRKDRSSCHVYGVPCDADPVYAGW